MSLERPVAEDRESVPVQLIGDDWPIAVSDGRMPCSDCGEQQEFGFDFRVDNDFWRKWVPDDPARLGVLCLPCLDRRCGGDSVDRPSRQRSHAAVVRATMFEQCPRIATYPYLPAFRPTTDYTPW